MKKRVILAVVFFGTLWGVCEALLGGWLYAAHVPYASVPLSIVGLAVLSVARARLPRPGTSTLVAGVAMLYKFLNTPLYGCHLLAILLLGLAYDAVVSLLPGRNRPVCAAAATYLGYALFALAITYVFRYEHWLAGGWPKVLRYVGVEGTMAGVGGALLAPLAFRLTGTLGRKAADVPRWTARWAAAGAALATAALWILPAAMRL
jgi:hypothetical protein